MTDIYVNDLNKILSENIVLQVLLALQPNAFREIFNLGRKFSSSIIGPPNLKLLDAEFKKSLCCLRKILLPFRDKRDWKKFVDPVISKDNIPSITQIFFLLNRLILITRHIDDLTCLEICSCKPTVVPQLLPDCS